MTGRTPPRGRGTYRHFTSISLRWADNDAYGHANNVVYYAWFDTAVNEWLIAHGLLDIERGDPIGLVVETGCRYFSSLAYPGTVEIGLAVERLGTSSVTYRLGVFDGVKRPPPRGTSPMSMSTGRRAVRWRCPMPGAPSSSA